MTAEPQLAGTTRWRVTAGLNDMGKAQGSGLRQPTYLFRRADGQVLQVSELLHIVVREVSPDRDAGQVAAAVSQTFGRQLTVEGLQHLVEKKLQPMGLIENSRPSSTARRVAPAKSNPLLALRLRRTLLPARAVQLLARLVSPLFFTPLVIIALGGLVALDIELFRRGGLVEAVNDFFATPTMLLALIGLLTAGALIHELGHAAACSYGGAKPGVVGVGVYLVFPAFFTNVTDSYRLNRAGRLRTDLGGLYFNIWCLFALGGLYVSTGNGIFLLAVLLMHIEMIQQLVPTVRFDGYFVLADLAGVPDLFARVRPVLLSLLPGRRTDPRVTELRPAARRIVTAWVLLVVPLLAFGFGWLFVNLPYLVRQTVNSVRHQADNAVAAWNAHDIPSLALAALSIVLLTLPMLGLFLLFWNILRLMIRLFTLTFRRRFRHTAVVSTTGTPTGTPGDPEPEPEPGLDIISTPSERSATPPGDALDASAFTDEAILGAPPSPPPGSGWRRAVYRASLGAVNPGPTPEERRRTEMLDRVNAPITGSRRVVVMSRKGGVGKTTITLALGSMYAMVRGDRVVAVDANPDAGNLAHRVSRRSPRTITDVLGEMDLISSYSDLRSYTSQAPESRLEVLASDDDPRIGLALDRDSYHRVIELLDRYYNLILLDTGTGILDSANQGLLSEADQLVLVLRPALDGARAAALTLDWLSQHGYGELVARAVVVINGVRRGGSVPVERIEDHFARRCAKVVDVPWDPALEAGAQTSIASLQSHTRDALIELAASVADHFSAQHVTRNHHEGKRDPVS